MPYSHGIGHGIIQRYRSESQIDIIKKSMQTCKEMSAIDGGLSNLVKECENGMWMDHFATSGNILAMESQFMAIDAVEDELKAVLLHLDDSHSSETIESRFQTPLPSELQVCALASTDFDCFMYAASEYLLVNPRDYNGAFQYCQNVESSGITADQSLICINGAAQQCAKENMDDFTVVEKFCQGLNNEMDGKICFRYALNYFSMSTGDSNLGSELCNSLSHYKTVCQQWTANN